MCQMIGLLIQNLHYVFQNIASFCENLVWNVIGGRPCTQRLYLSIHVPYQLAFVVMQAGPLCHQKLQRLNMF